MPRGSFLSESAPPTPVAETTKPLTDTDLVRRALASQLPPGVFFTAREIAAQTGLTSAHVNALLSKLIKNGHVERRHPARRGQFCNGRPGQAYRWRRA